MEGITNVYTASNAVGLSQREIFIFLGFLDYDVNHLVRSSYYIVLCNHKIVSSGLLRFICNTFLDLSSTFVKFKLFSICFLISFITFCCCSDPS